MAKASYSIKNLTHLESLIIPFPKDIFNENNKNYYNLRIEEFKLRLKGKFELVFFFLFVKIRKIPIYWLTLNRNWGGLV